ncbi:hypothetical protein TNCV_318811 [Trichonephila clavipes]|nr:hypothetical protein TNCV_318811 [Trichonephila clavipes]
MRYNHSKFRKFQIQIKPASSRGLERGRFSNEEVLFVVMRKNQMMKCITAKRNGFPHEGKEEGSEEIGLGDGTCHGRRFTDFGY